MDASLNWIGRETVQSIIGMSQSRCWGAFQRLHLATGKLYSRFWRRAN